MITTLRRLALATAIAAAAVAAPALAPQASAQKVVMSMSNADVAALLTSMGFDYTNVSDSVFKFQLNGHPVLFFNNGDDMQLYAGFRMDGSVSMKQVNDFNSEHRFCKAYLDDENDPVIEYDMNFDAGVTSDAVKRQIKIFRDVLEQYVTAIHE